MEMKQKVDRYAELTNMQTKIKEELEELKGFFETVATEKLKDTKIKTVSYWGSNNAKISVTNSETVKMLSNESDQLLRQLLGELFSSYVKQKITYEMNTSCKNILGAIFIGNYMEGSLQNIITQISSDSKICEVLKKKLKGNYEKDKAILISVAGIDENEASDAAYLIEEVVNWEKLTQILKAAKWGKSVGEAINHIKMSVLVEEGIKVTFEGEKKK